jgi:hypothetical protein
MNGRGAEKVVVWLRGLEMWLIVVMAHDALLLTAALYADEYLYVQIKGGVD